MQARQETHTAQREALNSHMLQRVVVFIAETTFAGGPAQCHIDVSRLREDIHACTTHPLIDVRNHPDTPTISVRIAHPQEKRCRKVEE
jgi:hypothetical protein